MGQMKSDGLLRQVGMVFAGAVVFYIGCFAWIEHRREFKGPWEVFFQTDAAGTPVILVTEKVLQISKKISFPRENAGQTDLAQRVRFDQPKTVIPLGTVVFQDATFLPGTVTMNFFRHEIELLPRVLVIDKKEYPWNGGDVTVTETGQIEPKPNTQLR